MQVSMVHAEVNLWSKVQINSNKSTVLYWTDYRLYDTSASGVGKHKITPVVLQWQHQNLPYSISTYYPQYAGANVDWCNLTVIHYMNTYSKEGYIENTTSATTNLFFENVNASNGMIQFDMVDLDTLTSYFECHYTNPQTLYIDGALFGQTTTYIPAFQCKGCDEHSFEELSKENEKVSQTIVEELGIYRIIYTLAKYNYTLWLYGKWLLMIASILLAVGFVFYGAYFFYIYFKRLEEVSRR
jgi:hypothetical protein